MLNYVPKNYKFTIIILFSLKMSTKSKNYLHRNRNTNVTEIMHKLIIIIKSGKADGNGRDQIVLYHFSYH